MIRFSCHGCGKQFSGADDLLGQQARCNKCGILFTVGGQPPPRKPPAQPARSVQPAAPSPPSEIAAFAGRTEAPLPAAEPSGFNLDLSALGPLDAPAFGAASAMPLGGTTLSNRTYRRKKKSNVVPWLVFSGTGFAGVAIVAILIVTLINLAGQSGASSPAAYLPPKANLVMSVRVRSLLDRAAAIPGVKPQIDQALSSSVAQGFDPHDIEEAFVAFDDNTSYIAARLARPVDLPKLPGVVASGDSHEGLPIYLIRERPDRIRPAQIAAVPIPRAETMYCAMPTAQLLVGAGDPLRLKTAIDRAREGRSAAVDLPSGYDLAIRVKDLKGMPGNARLAGSAGDELVGLTGTLRWADSIAFDLRLDIKDAPTAAKAEQKVKETLQLLSQMSQRGAANASAASVLSSIRVSASGSQLRVSGAIPTAQLATALPPAAGAPPMPGTSGQPSFMPGTPPSR